MKRALGSIALLSFLGLLLLRPVGLPAEEKEARGVIRGSLTNGTAGARVAGLKVVLKRYEGDREKESRETISDPQGEFFFPGLDRSKGKSYLLHAVYKDVKDQEREIPYEMTLYDTTDSDQKISVVMHHVVVEQKEGDLWVRELMIVENQGNKVYVGAHEIAPGKRETLRISLPPGAQELQLMKGLMSSYVVQVEDGLADTMDIKPGRKEILFGYRIDKKISGSKLSKSINLATDSLSFFIPGELRVKGENIQYVGLVGETGRQFAHFSGKKLARGSRVALKFENSPWAKDFFKGIVPVQGKIVPILGRIAPILGVILMGLGLIYPLIRRRKRPKGTKMVKGQGSKGESLLQEERQNLLWDIAELDDHLDSGQISPEEHAKKRRVLKEGVVELTRTLKSKGA
jgi:hypothetical protein